MTIVHYDFQTEAPAEAEASRGISERPDEGVPDDADRTRRATAFIERTLRVALEAVRSAQNVHDRSVWGPARDG